MRDSDPIGTAVSRETKIIDTLVQLADTLIEDYDVIEFLSYLSESCVSLVDADEAGIMVTDGRGSLQVVASSSERTRLLELFELQNLEGPCLEAFDTGSPVSSADLAVDVTRWPNFAREATAVGFHSVHSIPLRLRTEIIGSMNLLRTSTGDMSDADVTLARSLAQMATIGLLQERAITSTRIASTQLQSALMSRVRIEQAKGVIAERQGVDIDTAFDLLRAYARRHQRRLTDLAEAVARDNFDISRPPSP